MLDRSMKMGDGWGDNSAPQEDEDDGRRQYLTVDGRNWIIEARDPYGFWWIINPGGGSPPATLSGAYTGVWEAQQGLKQYMYQNPVSPAKKEALEKGTTPPEIKFKKVKSDAKSRPEGRPAQDKEEDSVPDKVLQGKVSQAKKSHVTSIKESAKDHKERQASEEG